MATTASRQAPRPRNRMSLKIFHIFFISISVLLCWGFAGWCFLSTATQGHIGYHLSGAAAILIGIGLVIYEIGFVKKFKDTP